MQANFYWPNYKQDIANWCTKCKTCEVTNARLNPKRAPLHPKPSLRRMEKVSVDILKVVESDDGHNSIMIASDIFTKYSEFYAMRDNTAQTCADLLCTQFFPRFDYPLTLHSDGGKMFESDLFKEMCSILDIQKTVTPRYRPQHNAVIERNNRTLIKMLKSVVEDNPKSWPDYLPFCMEAFNASVHSATGCTPNRLMFGCENRLPVHLMYGRAILEPEAPMCYSEYAEWLRDASQMASQKAREHLQKQTQRQKSYYDKNSMLRKFKVGDWVWVLYPPELQDKLGRPWEGPFLVIDKLGDVTYVVQKEKSGRKIKLHIDHIKRYDHDDTPNSWLACPQSVHTQTET